MAMESNGESSPEARDAVGDDEDVSRALALSAPPVAPRASVREKLMARVAAEPRAASPEGFFPVKPGVTGVRTATAAWSPTPIPGIEFKLLARDPERGTRTQLIRFAAGARYPRHTHGGTEEIFLIEGTVCVNGIVLQPGDYCRSEEGTEESGTYSATGGLALVVSSDRDEVAWPSP